MLTVNGQHFFFAVEWVDSSAHIPYRSSLDFLPKKDPAYAVYNPKKPNLFSIYITK